MAKFRAERVLSESTFFFVENAPPISTYAKMKGNTVAVGIGKELGREGQIDNLWDLPTIDVVFTVFHRFHRPCNLICITLATLESSKACLWTPR